MRSLDVVIPTYRRPELLSRCLAALECQIVQPNRIIVVVRDDDRASQSIVVDAISSGTRPELVLAQSPGQLAALESGLSVSTGEIVAFTDDDACPRAEWTSKLLAAFEDPQIGGAGGRDIIPGREAGRAKVVGRIRKRGTMIGNHHSGTGGARFVHVLKGVNMAFRADVLALPLPGVLLGSGAQVHQELLMASSVQKRGFRLLYDPSIQVDHYTAVRFDEDQRDRPSQRAIMNASHNLTLGLASYSRHYRLALWYFAIVGLLIGDRAHPGLGRLALAGLRGDVGVRRRLLPAMYGRILALCRGQILGAKLTIDIPTLRMRRNPTKSQHD